MQQDDFGDEVLLDEATKEEYELHWCLIEAENYIEKYGMEKEFPRVSELLNCGFKKPERRSTVGSG